MLDPLWKDLLRQDGVLPALPDVLIRLQSGLCNLDADIDALAGELQHDPALVAEILKMINSPLFAISRPIKSVKQAVVMLGLRRVRAIILSQSLRQSLSTYRSPGFALFRWWDRSMLTAIVAAMTCLRSAPDLAEEAFLAGLVADLGILILARYQRGYEPVLREFANDTSADFAIASLKASGIEHSELAAEAFRIWRFPPMVVEAVRRHHDPAVMKEPPDRIVAQSVFFAGHVTDYVLTGRPELCDELAALAQSCFAMSRAELDGLIATAQDRYNVVAVPLGHRGFRSPGAVQSRSA